MLRKIYSKLGSTLVLIILFVVLSFASPYFLQVNNLMNILLQVSITTIIGVGMTFVILTAGIDLSVGAIAALCVVSMAAIHKFLYPLVQGDFLKFLIGIVIPILAAIIIGALVGLINGTVISKGKVPAFIMTFGMMSIARGAAFVVTDNQTISVFPDALTFLGGQKLAGIIPIPVIISLIFVFAAAWILKYTKFGRYVYALGGNRETLRLSGVNTTLVEIWVYIICGITCAISAIILLGRLNVAQPVAGVGYEMDAIGAVIVGGTSIYGGEGKVGGTLFGAILMGTIRNGLNLLNVSPTIQPVVIGIIIIAAVFYDKARTKVKTA